VAAGADRSLALRAWQAGYDVWLGNFRGGTHRGATSHLDPAVARDDARFWDFSVNELAFFDIPAFVHAIRVLKSREAVGAGGVAVGCIARPNVNLGLYP
jgi:hypothetical protein